MNLFIRLFRVIIHAFFRSRIAFHDVSVVKFRVWLNDIDLNFHLTNSRYFSVMDLGRTDLLIRSGLGKHFIKNRWQAVLGSASLRFRRSLKPFQSYELHTRIIGLDEKWAYIEQRFLSEEGLVAYGIVRGIFVGKGGSIPIKEVLSTLNLPEEFPPLREDLKHWNAMEQASRHYLLQEDNNANGRQNDSGK